MTKTDPALIQAGAAVDMARQGARHDPAKGCESLATALLDLSHELERLDRANEAHHAAREAVDTLAAPFLKAPQSLASAMRQAVSRYIALSTMTGLNPDLSLLQPIAQALGDVMRREDDIEDSRR